MRPYDGKRVLLGVAGGIAAYKAAELTRLLVKAGAEVDVVLTEGGSRFVSPLTFEGLTGRRVRLSLWEGGLDHIELGRQADALVVAPATADLLARLANGHADDLLSTTLLAAPRRAILAPAMNHRMFEHPATQNNLKALAEFGHPIVGPAYGELAEREKGWGRMVEPGLLLEHVGRALESEGPWAGRRVVVTAGPTREPLDPVRFIGNRSSGRMGYAIAAAAWRRGAEVILVTGPGSAEVPGQLEEVHRVETAEEMAERVRAVAEAANALFMVAAVADFRPASTEPTKIRRSSGLDRIAMQAAPDVLAAASDVAPADCLKVAFAVEMGEDALKQARRKLEEKGAHMVVVNNPEEPGSGFDVQTNRVTIIDRDGEQEDLPRMLKVEVADEILDRAERWLASE